MVKRTFAFRGRRLRVIVYTTNPPLIAEMRVQIPLRYTKKIRKLESKFPQSLAGSLTVEH